MLMILSSAVSCTYIGHVELQSVCTVLHGSLKKVVCKHRKICRTEVEVHFKKSEKHFGDDSCALCAPGVCGPDGW